MMTLGMIALTTNAILSPNILLNLKKLFSNKIFLVLIGLFVVYIIGIFYSNNLEIAFNRLNIKLPFLIMPIGFAALPQLKKQVYLKFIFSFFALVFFTSLYVTINYLLNMDAYNEGYLFAKIIPTPIDHVRFSLFLVFAIISGFYLYTKQFKFKYDFETNLILGASILLIIFIHVLSVRSGLFALYTISFILGIQSLLSKNKRKLGIVLLILVFLLPAISLYVFPTFQKKIAYVKYDLNQFFNEKKLSQYSDSRRLLSIKVGLEVFQQNYLFGVGSGDMYPEMIKIYQRDYPNLKENDYLKPHNQFVVELASFGILGFLYFIFAILYPLWHNKNYKDWFFLSFHIIILSSFLWEGTIEGQLGMGFYIVFLLLGLNYIEKKPQLNE